MSLPTLEGYSSSSHTHGPTLLPLRCLTSTSISSMANHVCCIGYLTGLSCETILGGLAEIELPGPTTVSWLSVVNLRVCSPPYSQWYIPNSRGESVHFVALHPIYLSHYLLIGGSVDLPLVLGGQTSISSYLSNSQHQVLPGMGLTGDLRESGVVETIRERLRSRERTSAIVAASYQRWSGITDYTSRELESTQVRCLLLQSIPITPSNIESLTLRLTTVMGRLQRLECRVVLASLVGDLLIRRVEEHISDLVSRIGEVDTITTIGEGKLLEESTSKLGLVMSTLLRS